MKLGSGQSGRWLLGYHPMGYQRGVGLLEVLVALVIISVGLLGMAGLQARAVKSERDSFNQTMAMVYGDYIMERVRANAEDPLAATLPYRIGNAVIGNPGTDCDLLAADCTLAQRATQDIFEWQQQVRLNLPNADAIICLDDTPFDGTSRVNAAGVTTLVDGCSGAGTNYAIKLFWLNNRFDDATGAVDKSRLIMEFVP
ncbi:type IV pilus modification protein PilV [Aestuariirhabdus litorea]|uniref:Type IV pilus modification protein PilV n=1 Tax=Aestuariirhabdus litorea TaxID=2528527 RepID=A0A3P3VLG5_9GAMM|nr:type IV pilus modification protein PilV [Aestuariirhabdus litorea]RRJ83254.1 type IV pilus modification protein PilV [Aestuariirhabdus litorea]RWW93413.1 type IV pilus modification protein PilV [Endozoicomonadaceae bacterium GTF-13]